MKPLDKAALPGSAAALFNGCRCDPAINNEGAGVEWGSGVTVYAAVDCHLHGRARRGVVSGPQAAGDWVFVGSVRLDALEIETKPVNARFCSHPGCMKWGTSKGRLCGTHYQQKARAAA